MSAIKTYNVAIAGYGAFGHFLKRAWERLPNVRVLAITRTTEERARSSAEADGIPKYSSKYEDILSDPEIDIVAIATPPYLHAQQAVLAMEAGKDVLIEKPLATDVLDGQRVLGTATRLGRHAAVNFIMRYNPILERVKRVVDKRILGNLYRVLQENYASYQGLNPYHWFWDISLSGGILIEHGVHFFDLVNWIAGSDPAQVYGFLTSRTPGIEDKVLAGVEYSNGVIATFYNSFSRPAAAERTWGKFVFDRGELTTEGWIPLGLKLHGYVSDEELDKLTEIFYGAHIDSKPVKEKRMESSGEVYHVDYEIDLLFSIEKDKEEVYAQSAADLLADFIQSIEEPHHRMRVTIEDALASLRIAQLASAYRKSKGVYQAATGERM